MAGAAAALPVAPEDPDSLVDELLQPDANQARLTQTAGRTEHFLINFTTIAPLGRKGTPAQRKGE